MGIGVSLKTPRDRQLQRKLYVKAKQDSAITLSRG